MTRNITRKAAWFAALALTAATTGCAARADRGGFNCDRRWGAGTVGGALAGAAIGGGLGGGIAATSGETERQAEDLALGIGVGVVTGAALGALFGHCAFDERYSERVAPPLPPPPPPAPRPTPAPRTHRKIILRGVNFDFNKATIRRDAADILDEAAEILRDQPNVEVSVDGHTDAIGSDAYNQKLSERRAQAVADYLSSHGVSANRLRPRGFGESRPVASNDTEEGRAQNRRVELNIAGGDRGERPRRYERDDASDRDAPGERSHDRRHHDRPRGDRDQQHDDQQH
jgi:OOP family OmpA-OmpF porin